MTNKPPNRRAVTDNNPPSALFCIFNQNNIKENVYAEQSDDTKSNTEK